MTGPTPLLPEEALSRLQRALQYYGEVRGQSAVQVLDRGGRNLSIQLYRGFRDEAAARGDITFSAWTRTWRLGRDDPAEAGPENTGLSAEAIRRARAKIGGFRSILAMVDVQDGRVKVVPVYVGKRGKRSISRRRSKYARVVGGAAEDRTQYGAVRRPGDKVLNWRALATVEEINVREAGRRYLAVSWLYRRWRKLSSAEAAAGTERRMQNLNPRSRLGLLGEVVLDPKAGPQEATLTLTSHVPGVQAVGRARGIFGPAVEAVAHDMSGYAAQLEADQLAAGIRKLLRA